MKNIFISHSSKDKIKIDELVTCLKLLKCEVFYSSEASTNSIEFGQNFYVKIKEEILNSDMVIFMVSDNFYESIPSLIEVGIAYGEGKRMIPVAFKSGEYDKVLKGVFNTNQRLSCLDKEDDVIQLLSNASGSHDTITINKLTKRILNIKNYFSDNLDNKVELEREYTKEIEYSLDSIAIANRFKKLKSADYIMIKYIVEKRGYEFSFKKDYTHWENEFGKWLKKLNLDRDESYSGFLNYLNILGLLVSYPSYSEINLDTIEALEYIYDRDSEMIKKAINEYTYEILF